MQLSTRADLIPCLPSPSSMPILPSGSGIGYRENLWLGNLPTGKPILIRYRRSWPYQLTVRDRPSSAIRGRNKRLPSLGPVTDALKALSRHEGVTLFMTLVASFNMLLYRYTHQPDLAVGTAIANRNHTDIEGMIGFFVNTLVLRTNLSGNPSFRELLRQVRNITLGAYDHQDLPFEKLVEALRPERALSHNPLFQVMLLLQNTPEPRLDLPDIDVSVVPIDSKTAKLDLTVSLEEGPNGLTGWIEYATDLFEADTIARMAGHFRTLLADIAAHPERRLAEVSILTESERRQILLDWNRPKHASDVRHHASASAQHPCLHHLFEAQAEGTPDATAVVCGEERLTYRQLNSRANQLAHYLRAHGVGPGTLVGICTERSLGMIIGLLGILKAGGAYLPLDPTYPRERLAFILGDAQVAIVLTQHVLRSKLPKPVQGQAEATHIICLDTDWPLIAQQKQTNPVHAMTPDYLAYTIYTSGSTGQPKGVQINHRNVVHLVTTAGPLLAFQPPDVWTLFHSYAFDFSVWEIWTPLSYGSCLVVLTTEQTHAPALLYKVLATEHVTVLNLTPAAMRQLIDVRSLEPVRDLALRLIICGGEAFPADMLPQLLTWHVPIWNFYGPTEATVWAAAHPVGHAQQPFASTPPDMLPIGHPLPDRELYILDAHLQPVPIGVPGELCIGGIGLAWGYLNRPSLTAERFIPHPFSHESGARLYKTGDLARHLSDGRIEFLGRMDDQVKIRGFRVELGEIAAVLRQHPAVKEAVVVMTGTSRTTRHTPDSAKALQRLVAYVVQDQASQPTSSELRYYLQDKLPDYMLPSVYVWLQALPLTANGKINRQALPAPDIISSYRPETYIGSRTLLELQLTQIWEDILEVWPVGVKDNFFDLGGESMLAVRLMAQIHKRFGQELPLAALFHQAATIEHLATLLAQSDIRVASSPLVEIQRAGSKPPFFCIHPVGGNVLCYVPLARHLRPDQPFYGLQHPGLYAEGHVSTSVERLAAQYIDAIRTIQPAGPYRLGGWSLGGLIAFEMARQLVDDGQAVDLVALLDTWPLSTNRQPDWNNETGFFISFARHLGLTETDLSPTYMRQLEPDAQRRYILQQAQAANLLTADVDVARLQHYFRIFLSNLRAGYEYLPQPYPGHVTLFQASERASTTPQYLRRGWDDVVTGGVEHYTTPGNHYTMLQEPHVTILAQRLESCCPETAR